MPLLPIAPPLCADLGCKYFIHDALCTVTGRCPFLDEFGVDDKPRHDPESIHAIEAMQDERMNREIW